MLKKYSQPILPLANVLRSAWLFIIDMDSAIWAWCSIWFIEAEVLERRKHFVDTLIDDKRKKGLPLRLWYAAYRRRGIL